MLRALPFLLLALPLVVLAGDSPPPRVSDAAALEAFASRDYEAGIGALRTLLAEHPDDARAPLWQALIVRGHALRKDAAGVAREAAAALAARPDGGWSNAIRFHLVDALVDLGEERRAAEVALEALDRLASPAARERVARLYLMAADRAFTGVPTGEGPFRREGRPDLGRALALYRGARLVGLPADRAPAVAERIVRCLLGAKSFAEAAAEAAVALEKRPEAENRAELTALRAVALVRAGRKDEARRVARDMLERFPGDVRAADALLELGDLESLRLVRDRLADSPRASEAAWRVAATLEKAGEADGAIEAYRLFEKRYPDHEKAAEADFRIAEILLETGQHDRAREAYVGHRERHPLSPFWTHARQRAVDAVFLKGAALLDEGREAEAFRHWTAFAAEHPLDERVAKILMDEAHWHAGNGRPEEAYRVWNRVRTRYRSRPEASQAALRIGILFEETLGEVARAVAEYRTLAEEFPEAKEAKEAKRRLSVLRREELEIRLPRAFRTDETPHLEVVTRNVDAVSARLYEVDLVEYFRRHRTLAGLEDVLVDVVRPDETMKREVPGAEPYRRREWKLEIPRKGPGAAIVVVESPTLRAMTLLVVSDLTIITKEWRGGTLAFAQDARTGKPAAGVEVLAAGSRVAVVSAKTGADGVARLGECANPARLLAIHDGSIASDEFEGMRRQVHGRRELLHISTDRPLYRPGHVVAYRAVVRELLRGQIRNPAGGKVVVRVLDKVGNKLHENRSKLGPHGTVNGRFTLPPDLPPGDYAVAVTAPHGTVSHGSFRVEEYVKPDLLLSFVPERAVVLRGETVRATVGARYAFGKPVPGLVLALRVGGKPHSTLTTDAAGEAVVELSTTRTGPLSLEVSGRDVARRLVRLASRVLVAERGYEAALNVDPTPLVAGTELHVALTTTDPLGDPVARAGRLLLLKRAEAVDLYRPVGEPRAVATPDDGLASLRLRIDEPGDYRVRFTGEDRRGTPVVVDADVTVVPVEALRRIPVRAERDRYAEGETARIGVEAPAARFALVTLETGRVERHEVLELPASRTTVSVPLGAEAVPLARIRIALIHDGELWTGEDRVRVERHLNVSIEPGARSYRPGDLATVRVRTTDARGEPVSAEVALAAVDEAIYAIREDRAPFLGDTFLPPEPEDHVRTGSSADFAYAGRTSRLSADLLAERERRKSPEEIAPLLEEDAISDAPFDGPSTNSSIGIGGGAGGGFGGRGGRRNLRAKGGGGVHERLAELRKDFADTAYWNGALVTGPDGKATITFEVPDNLTTWRLTARAITAASAAGEGRGSFYSAKELAVLVSMPPVVRDGDEIVGAASVHNSTAKALDVAIDLEAREAVEATFAGATKAVGPGADVALDWKVEAPGHGTGLLAARVRAGDLTDAEQRSVRVAPYGVPIRTGVSGLLDAPVDVRLALPADVVPATLRAELRLPPSVSAHVLSSIHTLDAFPYGCVEQTVNRFYPALVASRVMEELGQPESRRRVDAAVRAGVRRLGYLQRPDGTWGWWRRAAPHPWMTAYATLALAEARHAEFEVPDRVLAHAVAGAEKLLSQTRDPDLRAFLRYALTVAGKVDAAGLGESYAGRSRLGPRGLAWLSLAYGRGGWAAQARALAQAIPVEMLPSGLAVVKTAPGRSTATETTALALRALLAAKGDEERIDRLALGLAARRDGASFGSTIETGAAVLALADYVKARGAGVGGFRVEVRVNDAPATVVEVEAGTSTRERVVKLPAEAFAKGANRIRIRRVGGGRSTFSLALSAVARTAPEATTGEPELTVARTHALAPDLLRLSPDRSSGSILRPGAARREPAVDVLEVGDVLRVTLRVAVRPGLRFLQIEDPLPAGFSALAGTTQGAVDETVIHEDRIVFFVAEPGEEVRVSYLARAGFPGRMRVPPARAFPMYRPEIVGYSGTRKLSVVLPGRAERELGVGLPPEEILAQALEAERKAPERAARLVRVLLERFELTDAGAEKALGVLARVGERRGRPAEVLEAYELRDLLRPGTKLGLEDAMRLARAAGEVGRAERAVAAVRRAAALLYERDRRALVDLEKEIDTAELALALAGRYPAGPVVEADLTRLANRAANRFDREEPDPRLLHALLRTRALHPDSPGAALLAVRAARSRLRAREWDALLREARLAAEVYPDHVVRAEADWYQAYALFALGRYEEVLGFAKKAYGRMVPLADGRRGASPYRRNLAHVIAQALEILGRREEALGWYSKIRTQSRDAAASVREMTERRLRTPDRVRVPVGETPVLRIETRNLGKVQLRVYPIDLLSFFALQKDLGSLRKVNLDGIAPRLERSVAIDGWKDREIHGTEVPLELEGPGVYVVLARAGSLSASSVVMVSDLELRVVEDGGGVRVRVRDGRTGALVGGAHVKVARGGVLMATGVTDARGIFDSALARSRAIEEDEVVEMPGPGGSGRRAVVVEKDGHVAAWW
jgi:uncharacterized protein YfaS (alpha-2-macroglobulin family)/tetratricopeptide (TPR) repeat protein